MIHKIYLLFIIACYNFINAQHSQHMPPDSLSVKSFEYFNKRIYALKNDSVKKLVYAHAWLKKAKAKQDFEQMVEAYKAIAYNTSAKDRLRYADSMVLTAKHTIDRELIGYAYMTKGIMHHARKELKQALDIYLIADRYISKTADWDTAYKIKFGMANTKYALGYYNEAITLFKECLLYFKNQDQRAYLNTMHSLSIAYNKIGEYKKCSEMNRLGIKTGIAVGNTAMVPYFKHSEGINRFSLRQYDEAIKILLDAVHDISANNDFANETIACFYIGKSYWAQERKAYAIPYFKKVDSAFVNHNYTSTDLRQAHELLIDYYRQQKDLQSQLYYINKLLKVDKVLFHDYKYLSAKVHKEYDTKKLLQAKTDIEQALQVNKTVSIGIIMAMTLVIIFMVRKHYRNKRLFEELMNRTPETVAPLSNTVDKESDLDINPELVLAILKNLEKFEHRKKYLQKEMTLMKMAAMLNTNTKYISKIVAHHRGKKFIEYINDLKIDHIIELLKTENKYRNYTNKALGEEAGFGSTQNFTRAFNNRTGISPTYFIEQLKKTQKATAAEA